MELQEKARALGILKECGSTERMGQGERRRRKKVHKDEKNSTVSILFSLVCTIESLNLLFREKRVAYF